jgi:uncharacterized protein (DUF302 family)
MTDAPIEHPSPLPFASTVARLVQAIEAAGLTIFARIDHAAAAQEAGLEMPPTTVLIYGAAKGGTPIMLAAPLVALDLPLWVWVGEGPDGATHITFHPAAPMLRQAGVPEALATRLDPAQRLLVEALGG